jgi:hypothetical protein
MDKQNLLKWIELNREYFLNHVWLVDYNKLKQAINSGEFDIKPDKGDFVDGIYTPPNGRCTFDEWKEKDNDR